jgi:hypothetical protein
MGSRSAISKEDCGDRRRPEADEAEVVKIHYGEGIANRMDGYFFPKTGISARFKILSVWIAGPP